MVTSVSLTNNSALMSICVESGFFLCRIGNDNLMTEGNFIRKCYNYVITF